MKLFVTILTIFPLCIFASTGKLSNVEKKALSIVTILAPTFTKGSIDLKSIEEWKTGKGKTAVKSVSCKTEVVKLSSGKQEKGHSCTIGLDSGLTIVLDKKLNPINISYFSP